MNKKSLVVQSNQLIEAKYRLSVEEQKIVKILISRIDRNDKDFNNYEFRIKDLASLLGMEHKDPYKVLQNITERLMSRVLKFYNPETRSLLQASWLSSAEYKEGEGTVTLCFDPKLKPLLLQLKSYFTKYELEKVMQFKGQYSIRFYEFRKSFLGRKKSEVVFTLKELRETLGLKKTEYKEFSNFKNRILEPARLELLEKTGKSFTWEPIKQGRGGKIVSIRFIFDGDDEIIADQEIPADLLTCCSEAKEPKLPDDLQSIFSELIKIGVSNKIALEMVKQYSVEQLQAALVLTQQQTNLQNPAGFLVKALTGEWHNSKQEEVTQQQQQRQEKKNTEARKKQVQQLKRKFMEMRTSAAAAAYQQIPELLLQQWQDEFMQTQPAILRRNKTIGFENPRFRAFVMERLALPSIEDFLKQEGIQLQEEEKMWWQQV